jgi:dTDP-4-amino-4,6-dideoxygalactose transaminase
MLGSSKRAKGIGDQLKNSNMVAEASASKFCVVDLAVFGGSPLFQQLLYVGRPSVPDPERLLARLRGVVDRKWLTNDGPEVREFEREVAALLGVRHCVAMCNGTAALQIAIRAAGLDGEVIVPSFTFIATAHALEWQGIQPVFCDIDDSLCLDPREVEKLITSRTTGVIGVHLWGHACNVESLTDLCRRRNLTLLFDAAHAFGCSHSGKMIGSFGRAEVFSFHATKFVNTLEGGAVATNDEDFAERCRAMRNFGFSGEDEVSSLGINAKMNEFEAAMGLASLAQMDQVVEANKGNYLEYQKGLEDTPGLRIRRYDLHERNNFQYIAVEVGADAGVSRDQLHELLRAENILARRYFYPGCHRMEPYRSRAATAERHLPRTARASDTMLCLPTGTSIDAATISAICALLRFAVRNHGEIEDRWEARTKVPLPAGILR